MKGGTREGGSVGLAGERLCRYRDHRCSTHTGKSTWQRELRHSADQLLLLTTTVIALALSRLTHRSRLQSRNRMIVTCTHRCRTRKSANHETGGKPSGHVLRKGCTEKILGFSLEKLYTRYIPPLRLRQKKGSSVNNPMVYNRYEVKIVVKHKGPNEAPRRPKTSFVTCTVFTQSLSTTASALKSRGADRSKTCTVWQYRVVNGTLPGISAVVFMRLQSFGQR